VAISAALPTEVTHPVSCSRL